MLFIHGHKFIEKDTHYYTSGSLNNEVFDRYVNIFGRVKVLANVCRYSEKNARFINDKNKVTNINFDLIRGKNGCFDLLEISKKIKTSIDKSEHIVIRMPSFYGIIAIHYAKKTKKKYLVEVVGCPWDAFWNHSAKGKVIAPFMWYMTKRAVKQSPYVLYVTNSFLQKRYPTKGKNIGCSDVVLPSIDNEILNKRLIKIKSMSKNQPIRLGTSAAVNVKYKGQEYVIKAISELNKEGYNFEYYLAGGGDNGYLKSIAEKFNVLDKVKFLGALPHKDIFNYLDSIDIYIQPSKQEGLPRALVEAMSRGCASIGSSTGGIPELLNDKFIFKKGNVKSICNILKSFNSEVMIEESKRSFCKAKEFNKEILDRKRTDFYKEYDECVSKLEG